MTQETAIALSVTLLVAFTGYFAKYLNDVRIAQRSARLERVDQQLRDLYGPLFSLVRASGTTWAAFSEQYCDRPDFRVEKLVEEGGVARLRPAVVPQSEETERIWRHWMKNVFMPLNVAMAQLVVDHSDLLEEEEMPECLLLLSAHVYGYKGILAAWEAEDFSRHMSLTSFPGDELAPYAERSYQKLKARQAQFLGNKKRRAPRTLPPRTS